MLRLRFITCLKTFLWVYYSEYADSLSAITLLFLINISVTSLLTSLHSQFNQSDHYLNKTTVVIVKKILHFESCLQSLWTSNVISMHLNT